MRSGDYYYDFCGQRVKTHYNQFGFEGPDLIHPKQSEEYRIMFLGGSTSGGWPMFLVDELNRYFKKPVFVMVNTAGGARASWYSLNFLIRYQSQINPDMIVIYNGYNDIHMLFDVTQQERKWIKGLQLLSFYVRKFSLFYTFIFEKAQLISQSSKDINGLTERVMSMYVRNMQEMISIAQKNGIEIILGRQPLSINMPPFQNEEVMRRILEKSSSGNPLTTQETLYYIHSKQLDFIDQQEQRIPVVDVIREFERYSPEELFGTSNVHYTCKGIKLIAKIFFETVTRSHRIRGAQKNDFYDEKKEEFQQLEHLENPVVW